MGLAPLTRVVFKGQLFGKWAFFQNSGVRCKIAEVTVDKDTNENVGILTCFQCNKRYKLVSVEGQRKCSFFFLFVCLFLF